MFKFKYLLFFPLLAILCAGSCSENRAKSGDPSNFKYTWETVYMDSTWNDIKNPAATEVIAKYSNLLAPLQEIIGYSEGEYGSDSPESPLSNFIADMLRECAEKFTGEKVDLSMLNFGGIRTSLPKGAVRVYDIYSILPFDNRLVVLDIRGSQLRKLIEKYAKRGKTEAFSNVELVIDNFKLTKANIDGKPLDDNKLYKFASIDFLLDTEGGLRPYSENVTGSNIFIRDAVVNYIREMKGNILLKKDGRVTVKNCMRDKK